MRQISVTTNRSAEEPVFAVMEGVFGTIPTVAVNMDNNTVTVTVYLPDMGDSVVPDQSAVSALRRKLKELKNYGIALDSPKISNRRIREIDWKESWKRHFRPIQIGKSLLVRPSWSRPRSQKGLAEVVLDPGLSFGTGQHPTTHFCLREIEAFRSTEKSQSFLDVGTGTGLLAIAAAKLGYAPIKAFDFDPDSVRIARGNASENGVAEKLRITRFDLRNLTTATNERRDLICANLMFDLLIEERAKLLNRLAPEGRLVLAGILSVQFPQVEEAYRKSGCRLIDTETSGEWTGGSFRK